MLKNVDAANGPAQCRKSKDCIRRKTFYEKRRTAGLCTYGTCPELPEAGHTQCPKHLRHMRDSEMERRKKRINKGLCVRCGAFPKFWGLKCVRCRQFVAADPLPAGARRALRVYRADEEKRLKRQIENDVRLAVINLLSSRAVRGKSAEALRFYAGVDTKKWRTYEQVGKLMGLTKERIRQLLVPSKLILSTQLSGRVPWHLDKTVPYSVSEPIDGINGEPIAPVR